MVDKSLLIKVVRIINFISAGLMILDSILRFVDFATVVDPFFYLLTIYLLGFSALLIIAELRIKRILVYVEFLKSRIGKGIYIALVGLLIFDESRKGDMAISIALVLIGVFNIIVSCIRDKKGPGE